MYVVVIGGGNVGYYLTKELLAAGHEVVVIEEEQARLRRKEGGPVTIGDARAALQRAHQRQLLGWLHEQFQAGATPHELAERLAA